MMFFWGFLAAVVLLLEHLLCWGRPWRLTRPQAYTVGVATLGLCFSGWAMTTPGVTGEAAVIAWWVIAAMSGAVISSAYWLRGRMAEIKERSKEAGFTAAQAVALSEEPAHGDN